MPVIISNPGTTYADIGFGRYVHVEGEFHDRFYALWWLKHVCPTWTPERQRQTVQRVEREAQEEQERKL